jgi:hypothetical protein
MGLHIPAAVSEIGLGFSKIAMTAASRYLDFKKDPVLDDLPISGMRV